MTANSVLFFAAIGLSIQPEELIDGQGKDAKQEVRHPILGAPDANLICPELIR